MSGKNSTRAKADKVSTRTTATAAVEAPEMTGAVESVSIEDLRKQILESGAVSFGSEELREELKREKEAQYPDFGAEIPEGITLTLMGLSTLHEWKSKRTGRISKIRTAFAVAADGTTYEVPFAAFSKPQYDFLVVKGVDEEGALIGEVANIAAPLPYLPTAERNLRVVEEFGEGDKVRVRHAWGHPRNPYADRIWDRTITWVVRVNEDEAE